MQTTTMKSTTISQTFKSEIFFCGELFCCEWKHVSGRNELISVVNVTTGEDITEPMLYSRSFAERVSVRTRQILSSLNTNNNEK